MHVGEFGINMPGKLAAIVAGGEPVKLTRYRHDYAYVVPADIWDAAQRELAALREIAAGALGNTGVGGMT